MTTLKYYNYIKLLTEIPRLRYLIGFSIGMTLLSLVCPFTIILAFVSTFVFYDIVGYAYIAGKFDWDEPASITEHDSALLLRSYRILQGTFHILFMLLILVAFGWKYAIACELLHWFGVADLLYYWIYDTPLPKIWTWLSWTPFGIFIKSMPNWVMLLQCVMGLLLSLIIIFL